MIIQEDNCRIRIVYLVLFRLWYTIPGTDDGSREGKGKKSGEDVGISRGKEQGGEAERWRLGAS